MKTILIALASLTLASCLATQAALDNLNAKLLDESATTEDLHAAVTQLRDAPKQDALTLTEGLAGGGGVAALLLGLGRAALVGRDKRKLAGGDPLEARIKVLEAKPT